MNDIKEDSSDGYSHSQYRVNIGKSTSVGQSARPDQEGASRSNANDSARGLNSQQQKGKGDDAVGNKVCLMIFFLFSSCGCSKHLFIDSFLQPILDIQSCILIE